MIESGQNGSGCGGLRRAFSLLAERNGTKGLLYKRKFIPFSFIFHPVVGIVRGKKMEMECLIQLLMTHLPCNQSVLTIKIRLLFSFCQAAQKTTRHVTSMKSYQDIIIWNSFFCICSHSFVRTLLHITKAFHILLPYVLFYLNCNLSSVSISFSPDNTRERLFQVNGEDK